MPIAITPSLRARIASRDGMLKALPQWRRLRGHSRKLMRRSFTMTSSQRGDSMMHRKLIGSFLVLLTTLIAPTCEAQPGGGGFRVPKVGTKLPVVTVYDARGRKFSTKSIRGQHAVIAFGCLT